MQGQREELMKRLRGTKKKLEISFGCKNKEFANWNKKFPSSKLDRIIFQTFIVTLDAPDLLGTVSEASYLKLWHSYKI